MSKKKNKNLNKINVQALRDMQVSWSPKKANLSSSKASVKREIESPNIKSNAQTASSKTSVVTAEIERINTIRADIKKCLFLVSLVLALEIMIYLGWSRNW